MMAVRDFPIGCGPDNHPSKKVNGSDSEVEIEPEYVDYESDVEDRFNEGDESFKEFLKTYQNPNLEGFGDSDDVEDGTGFTEIKDELESMKKNSALFDYFECNVVGESRELQEEEEEPNYIYDGDALGYVVESKSKKRSVPCSNEYDDDAELFKTCSASSSSSHEYDGSGRVVGMKSKKRCSKLESNPISCSCPNDHADSTRGELSDVVTPEYVFDVDAELLRSYSDNSNVFDDSGYFLYKKLRPGKVEEEEVESESNSYSVGYNGGLKPDLEQVEVEEGDYDADSTREEFSEIHTPEYEFDADAELCRTYSDNSNVFDHSGFFLYKKLRHGEVEEESSCCSVKHDFADFEGGDSHGLDDQYVDAADAARELSDSDENKCC